ncbi:MAG: hypothetical protein HFJ12_06100 [Bacilli bacterium]|nr:hypothetical protein [Bacilli bacterium]
MKRRQRKKRKIEKIIIMIIPLLPPKSDKVFSIVGVVGVLFAILTFIISYFEISYTFKPSASIQEKVMSVSYLSELGNRQDKYPMFNDNINDMKKYIYIDNCATQVIITNDYNSEILLEEMVFEAKDIVVDNSPILECDLIPNDNFGVNIMCVNHGWGDANNVTINLDGEGLDDFIVENKHSIFIPSIPAGERVDLPIWEVYDLIKENCTGELYLKANCVDSDGNVINVMDDKFIFIAICDGEFTSAGGLGPSEEIYGIKINTSSENYEYSFNISESIKAKERIELPICFFPDKSCSLKFRISFTVVYNNNDRMNISTDWAELKFQISSLYPYGLNNVLDFNKEQLLEIIHEYAGDVKVTYPFVDRTEMQDIESEIEKVY